MLILCAMLYGNWTLFLYIIVIQQFAIYIISQGNFQLLYLFDRNGKFLVKQAATMKTVARLGFVL